ncbi:N-succinylarginine dihydrolase [Ostreibacterium oceani]|uniref:N-succinylarginine dihydrolase n=1 Tax=Ostreibacterium oceani TaxID=2654998 RepID=A0A6N7F1V0_9GAMM|nr:N-succinylarginine dihydrolase [Ostreibacterium oceani]MPV86768.1 N-succinylarginine dihydrolase [Ostreibacterium oceani]
MKTNRTANQAYEVNFDGLVGNTHNYAGLSYGNVASATNKGQVSSPKTAALQGLAKMKALADMGLKQGILPPHCRPYLSYAKRIGFLGSDAQILAQLSQAPTYLNALCSASNMWVANAATVTPSADSADGRVHFTPANLATMLHRAVEAPQTAHALRCIFNHPDYFAHHEPLPTYLLRDEGAANHTRFCQTYGDTGVHLFVYGYSEFEGGEKPQKYPARQTKESFEAIMRRHGIAPENCVFAQQHPDVIDQGVFHNDVISVGNQHVLFTHEKAFLEQNRVYQSLQEKCGTSFEIVEVPDAMVSVKDAVSSYLFNSQLISTENGMTLIAPSQCQDNFAVNTYLKHLVIAHNPITDVKYFDLKQSMANGGGPACLRLRVVLTDAELAHLSGNVILTERLYNQLVDWVNAHYRDTLSTDALADIALYNESQNALSELSSLLELDTLYQHTN